LEDKKKSFEKRIEELQTFKAKHGHVRVTRKHDKSLYGFCSNTRCARHGTRTGDVITEDRIKALDELGFTWEDKRRPVWRDKNKSFEGRIEELKAFKEKHGHVRVTGKEDQNIASFCGNIISAHRNPGTGMTITEDRIKALDELGFDGHPQGNKKKIA